MKIITVALFTLVVAIGCHPGPTPETGMAALRVKVIAEPKTGVQPPPVAVSTHDTPADQGYGPHARVDYSQLDNIVIWVEPAPGAGPAKAPAPAPMNLTVDPQKSSHGIDAVVSVGQKLVLRNAGAKAQSIYSVSDGNDFELSSVPASGSAEYAVRSAGLIEIFADSSKDIAVQLFATPTPWAQIGRSGQTLDFNNIPPGHYQLVSWHPRLPGSTEPVELTADHVTDASIKVGVNSLPKVTADASR
jgi:hypothetical protein